MRPSRHNNIRAILLRAEDGLTAKEIGLKLDTDRATIAKTMPNIYGVYIDRWIPTGGRGAPSAVYICVPIPKDTPKP